MNRIIKLLYPDRCPLCDSARPINEAGICPECNKKLVLLEPPNDEICPSKEDFFDGGKCSFAYSKLTESIYKFKYLKRAAYAKMYAELMVKNSEEWFHYVNPDVLIPVPLHKKRLIARGYNQSKELADELSLLLNIPVSDSCVQRCVNTVPQKLMNKRERRANVKNAFIVTENVVNFNKVVIVDDIYTTGSTINAISRKLKQAGVKEVYFITLAKAGV